MATGCQNVVSRTTILGVGVGLLVPLLLASAPGVNASLVLSGSPDVDIESLDTSAFPKKYQDGYKVFAVRCSKCHTLSRAINGRLTPEGWRNYVKKMSRRSGSGINESNSGPLVDFLIFYTQLLHNPDGGSTP